MSSTENRPTRSKVANRKGGPRRRLSPDDRRAQLIRCGLSVFAERGIRRAVHADVARVASCAVSTVFLYFPTRDDLVDGVLDEVENFYVELAEQVHATNAPAQEVLVEHGRRFRASIDSHPDHAYILLNWAASARSRVWPRYLEFTERMVANHSATIARGIREGTLDASIDVESAARIIIGYAQMSAQMKLAKFEPERADQISKRIVSAMLSPSPDERADETAA
jgi:TetR/AcrR family hemagglutinin/protease transcriptional regulator